jgi:hypothetical protein
VHQPAFVGLLEAMAYADLQQADPNPHAYGYDMNPGLGQQFYYDTGAGVPVYNAPIYEAPVAYDTNVAPAYEAVPEIKQTLVSAPVESTTAPARPRALTIQPMPPPIQSFVAPSTTSDRLNSILNQGSILLIVDGIPKDFGVGVRVSLGRLRVFDLNSLLAFGYFIRPARHSRCPSSPPGRI